jgi:hypothetical protein
MPDTEKAGLKSRCSILMNEITNKSKNNIYSDRYFCHEDYPNGRNR